MRTTRECELFDDKRDARAAGKRTGQSAARSALLVPRSASVPSRHDNPFATCWTRPGAISFRFPKGLSGEAFVARLASQNWHGAIIGPHGSGKSALLETLKPMLRAAGWALHAIAFRDGRAAAASDESLHKMPDSVTTSDGHRMLVVVDGYEQLTWMARVQLRRRCRRDGLGLLVTAHGATRLPTLVRLQPDLPLVQRLVEQLIAEVSTQITPADVAASYQTHGANVREILFDLYDRHECGRRFPPAASHVPSRMR